MNTRQLQYAIALAKVRNFSQVAERLNISQPALSKQIIHLESELGVKLFDRSTTPLSLTPAGEYFIRESEALCYREEQLLRSMDRFRSGELGRLTIGITPFRSLYLLPGLLQDLKARYPGVRVVLHEAGSEALRKSALEGKVDFAVVNLPVDESVLDVMPLEADELVLAVPNALTHLIRTPGNSVALPDCGALPFVVVGENQEMRQLFDKLCAAGDYQPNISAEVVGITTAWAMARSGIGATLLPRQFVRGEGFCAGLTLYAVENCSYVRQPAIITRRGQYISEYAAYAMQLLTRDE